MFLLPGSSESTQTRFPRARGDVPFFSTRQMGIPRFSPRTRGCSSDFTTLEAAWAVFPAHAGMFRIGRGKKLCYSVFPAHAGMFRFIGFTNRQAGCFPRARGDVPNKHCDIPLNLVFSPRTRGCSARNGGGGAATGVFPAHAGMFRVLYDFEYRHSGFPRARGDVP